MALSTAYLQALKRKRPFARRRFSTKRPFLVAMRARKPCLRLRLILLGWNVLFMAQKSSLKTREIERPVMIGRRGIFVKFLRWEQVAKADLAVIGYCLF
jgi:hypothetical protein